MMGLQSATPARLSGASLDSLFIERRILMYAVIRRYQFDPSASEALDRNLRETLVPLLKDVPGFVTYYWLNSGAGAGASLSVFDSQEGAEASVRAAANFVQQHLSGLTMSKAEILEGEVQAHA
jgi:hypothetical protein